MIEPSRPRPRDPVPSPSRSAAGEKSSDRTDVRTTVARDIPEATVARLPVYLRALTDARPSAASRTCSSEELAGAAGVNSAKLRKDLSYLGSYGTRGVGYDVDYLRYQIAREIGLTQDWPVVIVGIGNLGHALANYSGFRSPRLPGRRPARRRPRPARRAGRRRSTCARSTTSSRSSASTASRSASSPPRPSPPRTSPTGWSPPASPASSTSRRPCCPCPRASTCARSTCPSSCRSSPSTSSARRARAAPTEVTA